MHLRDILITDRTARLPSDYAPQDSQDLQASPDAPAVHVGPGNGIVAFRVDCIPVAQPRQRHRVIVPKSGKQFASNYTPKSSPVQQFKHEIRQAFSAKRPDDWNVTRPMEVRLVFTFPRPASRTRKRGENPPYPKAGKPDADNLAKAVLDALNGLAWNDDSQVAILYVAKWVGEPGQVPGVTVTIEAIE